MTTLQIFTDRVKKQAKKLEVSRKTVPSSKEALIELTEVRSLCVQSPYRVYLDGETTLVLAKRG